mgnify:CR=1 FL=1
MNENKENTTEKDVNNSQDTHIESEKNKKIKLSTIVIIIVIFHNKIPPFYLIFQTINY